MFQKLDKIMLVDDSESDNFIHKKKILKADVTHNVVIQYSGEEALEYLCTKVYGKYPKPELVFLDINMPGMNGWEFLEAYDQIAEEMKANVIITMLTTSINEEDEQKAEEIDEIKAYENKPLTQDKLMRILKEFFPERFISE